MKIKGRSIDERNQGEGGGEGKGNYWGMILAKLYCCIVCMYEHITKNSITMYNYNASIKI